MWAFRLRPARALVPRSARKIATLSSNPHIKVFPITSSPNTHLLSYLDTNPPDANVAIGSTTAVPPTPSSFQENPRFLAILNEVLAEHAKDDEGLQAQAKVFASPGGSIFSSGNTFVPRTGRRKESETGAGGASAQGGAGGAGIGGWVHLSDQRNPPDFGRIAWPEDILGSVEVDGHGKLLNNFQPSGTYRIVTREGILGLSSFLRKKLIARLKHEETKPDP
ncbi:hypothetical protein GQ53DRAFT_631011 [Thozetella sp. PMI_491]|nr:hypothetical protein GQ53DRAFT_631011 [Thozetella sp. PMI_491]